MDIESLAEIAIAVVVLAVGVAAAFNTAGAAERMSRSATKSLSPMARRGDRFVTSVQGTHLIGALLMVGAVAALIWPRQ